MKAELTDILAVLLFHSLSMSTTRVMKRMRTMGTYVNLPHVPVANEYYAPWMMITHEGEAFSYNGHDNLPTITCGCSKHYRPSVPYYIPVAGCPAKYTANILFAYVSGKCIRGVADDSKELHEEADKRAYIAYMYYGVKPFKNWIYNFANNMICDYGWHLNDKSKPLSFQEYILSKVSHKMNPDNGEKEAIKYEDAVVRKQLDTVDLYSSDDDDDDEYQSDFVMKPLYEAELSSSDDDE